MEAKTETFTPATERQMGFIADLYRAIDPDNAPECILAIEQGDPFSKADASALIERLINQRGETRKTTKTEAPAPRPTATASTLSEGFYRANNGNIFQVFTARNGAHLLAKVLIEDSGEWEYKGAASRFVKADQRMTLAEAQDYGKRTGRCMVCTRKLTNPESVANGIGPVCARRF